MQDPVMVKKFIITVNVIEGIELSADFIHSVNRAKAYNPSPMKMQGDNE